MAKRAFDVVGSVLLLPLVLPVVAATALAAAVDLRGNPFFAQKRIGRDGVAFTMLKLRTMRHARPGDSTRYRVEDWTTFVFDPPDRPNPRTTRLGAVLRKLSIDELPNLWNVLRGEMSLVGPRPEVPEIVEQYPAEYHRRHAVRPGVTGLAQVRGRSDLAYSEIMKYDLAYVDHHSVPGDLRLLGETLAVVFRGMGAR